MMLESGVEESAGKSRKRSANLRLLRGLVPQRIWVIAERNERRPKNHWQKNGGEKNWAVENSPRLQSALEETTVLGAGLCPARQHPNRKPTAVGQLLFFASGARPSSGA
jgi:hypothetical protein